MAVVLAQSVAVVKKSYKNGKVPEYYEGIPLIYNKNAFSTLDDVFRTVQSNGGIEKIVILDSSVTVNAPLSDIGVSLNALLLDDGEEKYKAKGTFKANADVLSDLNYFKTVTVNNASVKNILGGNVDVASNGALMVKAQGAAKVTSGDVNGNITYYKTVNVLNGNVKGRIESGDILTATLGIATETDFISSGTLTFKADKKAVDSVYTIGSDNDGDDNVISGFKTVTVTGFDKNDKVVALVIDGDVTGGIVAHSYAGGYVDLTVSSAVGTLKLTQEVTVNGSVQGFKTVTLKDDIVIDGDILGGLSTGMAMGAEKSDGKLTASDDVFVSGTIFGYKTVTLTESAALGGVSGYSTKGTALNLTDSVVGEVEGMQKVTVKKGVNAVAEFIGTAMDDTFTINKNSAVTVDDGIDFGYGSKDKLVVNGTLVLKTADVQGFESMTGSGEIACADDIYDDVRAAFSASSKHKVKFLNLGATSDNFAGTKYESGDDTAKKAYEWDDLDMEYKGWLSDDVSFDCVDKVDYIEFDSERGGTLQISGEGITVYFDGMKQEDMSAIAFSGYDNDHILEIRVNAGAGAVAYSIQADFA